MKPTLLILAAGMGSRYGGLKQMDELGPNGEAIIDYSVFDAIRAGFGKVVFVIRESFADAFKERFEPSLKGKIETEYVFQNLDDLPEGFSVPEGREKPWGTGHAMLMAKDVIKEPFAVVNADDFYGQEAYELAIKFIKEYPADNEYAMIGYPMRNTLSEFGTVSRGVCNTNEKGYLQTIVERTKIGWEGKEIFFYEGDEKTRLNGNDPVSMNFWVFKPDFFAHMETSFKEFLKKKGHEMKSEFFFNITTDELIRAKKASTLVIDTDSNWFGVTYQEDKPMVQSSINKLIEEGKYPARLWK
jgi:UTP-glucose-1-phosphate uridylyltransferase